jgi:hypothetical protein
MPARGVTLTGLYVFNAICAIFATDYGALNLGPSQLAQQGPGPPERRCDDVAAETVAIRVIIPPTSH